MSSTFKCSLILDKLLEADGVVLAWLTRAHCWHWWHWRCSEWRSSPGPGVTTQAAWSPIRDEHGAPPATLTSQQSREEPGAELAQNITSALCRALHCNVHNCLTLRANSAPALSFISFWLIKAYNGLAQWQWLISLTNTLPGAPATGLACAWQFICSDRHLVLLSTWLFYRLIQLQSLNSWSWGFDESHEKICREIWTRSRPR